MYDPTAKVIETKPRATIERTKLSDTFSVVADIKLFSDGRKSLVILGENIKDFHEAALLMHRYNTLNGIHNDNI